MIIDVLQLIYRVDKITEAANGDSGNPQGLIKITPEAMARVQLYLKDFAVKVQTTKTHLKESLSLLNELTFDLIERLLMGHLTPQTNSADNAAPPAKRGKSTVQCQLCAFTCVNPGALKNHMKKQHNAA